MPKNSELKIGEIVVYPKHGVGEITKIESMEISGIKSSFYVVKMEQSKLVIRVPIDTSVVIVISSLAASMFIVIITLVASLSIILATLLPEMASLSMSTSVCLSLID